MEDKGLMLWGGREGLALSWRWGRLFTCRSKRTRPVPSPVALALAGKALALGLVDGVAPLLWLESRGSARLRLENLGE